MLKYTHVIYHTQWVLIFSQPKWSTDSLHFVPLVPYIFHFLNIMTLSISSTYFEHHFKWHYQFNSTIKYELRDSLREGEHSIFYLEQFLPFLLMFCPFWNLKPSSAIIFFLFRKLPLVILTHSTHFKDRFVVTTFS